MLLRSSTPTWSARARLPVRQADQRRRGREGQIVWCSLVPAGLVLRCVWPNVGCRGELVRLGCSRLGRMCSEKRNSRTPIFRAYRSQSSDTVRLLGQRARIVPRRAAGAVCRADDQLTNGLCGSHNAVLAGSTPLLQARCLRAVDQALMYRCCAREQMREWDVICRASFAPSTSVSQSLLRTSL